MIDSLRALFFHELQDLYRSASAFLDVLKRMSSFATDPKLAEMLDAYYFHSEYQKRKLAEYLGEEAQEEESCLIAEALCRHALGSMRQEGSKELRDSALLFTVNSIKHFEITMIGTLLAHAELLKLDPEIELLFSLKAKIGEEEKKAVEIAERLLKKDQDEEGIEQLFSGLLKTHVKEEQSLLEFLPLFLEQVSSNELKEALATYQREHKDCLSRLLALSEKLSGEAPVREWRVIESFFAEWEEDLSGAKEGNLRDCALILSMQRVQHQQIALYEFEQLFSDRLEELSMQEFFHQALSKEVGYDQSLSALANGSLFKEGLQKGL